MIKIIKFIHTIIWIIMALAALYILYAGVFGLFNWQLYISIGLLVVETIVLLFNKWTCPLTPLAKNYTSDRKDNFDIYLPNWLAKYNKIIFGTIFILGLALVMVRFAFLIKNRNFNVATNQPNINYQSEAEPDADDISADSMSKAKKIIIDLINNNQKKSELKINIIKATDNYIKAEIFYNPGGSYLLAAKKDGEWINVLEGNGIPKCTEVSPYGFPVDIIPSCFDEYRDELIQNEWQLIKDSIINCRVKEIMQTHSLYVKADLKNGDILEGFEPAIDEIIRLTIETEKKCGKILMATE